MGKVDNSNCKRYNKVKQKHQKKELDERRQRALNKGELQVRKTEPTTKATFRKGVSQFTKAVREFGERRSAFASKEGNGAKNKQHSYIGKGRLTLPTMGIFMRSKVSSVAVREKSTELSEINQARFNNDLRKIVRLANGTNDEENANQVSLSGLENRCLMPAVAESNDESEVLDDPPSPCSLEVFSIFSKKLGVGQNGKREEKMAKEVGLKGFSPKVMSTAKKPQTRRMNNNRGKAATKKRTVIPQPKVRKSVFETLSRHGKIGDTESEDDDIILSAFAGTTADECATRGSASGSAKEEEEDRLPIGLKSLRDLYKQFASSFISDVAQAYDDLVEEEGYSSIMRAREELTDTFRKTCERVLREEGKTVDELSVHNLTLQIYGTDKHISPKHGTMSSLKAYKKRNRELFPESESEAEGEDVSDPLSLVPPQSPAGDPRDNTALDRDTMEMDTPGQQNIPCGEESNLSPSKNYSPNFVHLENEGNENVTFDYSPEVDVDAQATTLDPIQFIQNTLGHRNHSSTEVERRPSLFNVLSSSDRGIERSPLRKFLESHRNLTTQEEHTCGESPRVVNPSFRSRGEEARHCRGKCVATPSPSPRLQRRHPSKMSSGSSRAMTHARNPSRNRFPCCSCNEVESNDMANALCKRFKYSRAVAPDCCDVQATRYAYLRPTNALSRKLDFLSPDLCSLSLKQTEDFGEYRTEGFKDCQPSQCCTENYLPRNDLLFTKGMPLGRGFLKKRDCLLGGDKPVFVSPEPRYFRRRLF